MDLLSSLRRPRSALSIALLVLLMASWGCWGCSSARNIRYQDRGWTAEPDHAEGSYYDWIKELLYEQFKGWRAVEYRFGGLSKKGVDCSGFVYLTFLRKFRIRIPRTTERQLLFGERVSLLELRPGDLVFFDTGWNKVHVGIYIEKGRFLHSSQSQGVSISRLQNGYWAERHFRSRRILGEL